MYCLNCVSNPSWLFTPITDCRPTCHPSFSCLPQPAWVDAFSLIHIRCTKYKFIISHKFLKLLYVTKCYTRQNPYVALFLEPICCTAWKASSQVNFGGRMRWRVATSNNLSCGFRLENVLNECPRESWNCIDYHYFGGADYRLTMARDQVSMNANAEI